jgi:hypothetical protein
VEEDSSEARRRAVSNADALALMVETMLSADPSASVRPGGGMGRQ